MLYLFPIFGALALATLTIMEKIVLRKKKIGVKLFQTFAFLMASIVMIPFLYFFWKVSPEAFFVKNILIFIGVIVISLFANLSMFFALKWEKVSNIEPALIMEPMFTILLAIVFSFFTVGLFDRNLTVIIPGLIAASALIFSHIKKHHLDFNKYFLAAVLGAFLFALELVTSRLILDYYNPLTFYFIRCSGLFLISFILFLPKFSGLKTKIKWNIFIIGSLWVVYRVIIYYGYLILGVIFTTLIVMLGPVFVYVFARIFLKEKLEWRNIIASIVIVACVLYAVLI